MLFVDFVQKIDNTNSNYDPELARWFTTLRADFVQLAGVRGYEQHGGRLRSTVLGSLFID